MSKNQQDVMNWIVKYVADPTPRPDQMTVSEFQQDVFEAILSSQAQALGLSREEVLRGMIEEARESGYLHEPINC